MVGAEGRMGTWGGCGTCHSQAEGSLLCRDMKAELLHVLWCPLSPGACPAKQAGCHLQVEAALPGSPGFVGEVWGTALGRPLPTLPMGCSSSPPQLMKCVRLPLLSRDFLMSNVDTELLVRHHSECKDLLIEALKYHLMPEQRGVLSNSRTRPRRCEGASTVLFAVGKAPPRPHLHADPFPGPLDRCLLCLPSRAQVGGACSPSTGTARPTTRGRTGGTWWPPCRLAGPEWALLPSGTSCTPWAGKEGREPCAGSWQGCRRRLPRRAGGEGGAELLWEQRWPAEPPRADRRVKQSRISGLPTAGVTTENYLPCPCRSEQ